MNIRKKFFLLIFICIAIVMMSKQFIHAGGRIGTMKNDTFYNRLLMLEKENSWKMLSEQSVRVGPSYKRIFKICFFNVSDIKQIDIKLFTPEDWPSKNLLNYALSPDGKEITFVISERDQALNLLYSLYILDINTGNIEKIIPPHQFSEIGRVIYLPDGNNIIFIGKLNEIKETTNVPQFGSLYRRNLKTKETIELIHYGVFTITTQSCSPDGRRIVYQNSNFDEIFVYDLMDNKFWKLANGICPTWRPDGLKISYSGKDGNYYLINADGSGNELFILNKPKREFNLSGERVGSVSGELLWSPNGQYVYYEREAVAPFADVENHLPYVMDVSTKEEKRLPNSLSGITYWISEGT